MADSDFNPLAQWVHDLIGKNEAVILTLVGGVNFTGVVDRWVDEENVLVLVDGDQGHMLDFRKVMGVTVTLDGSIAKSNEDKLSRVATIAQKSIEQARDLPLAQAILKILTESE